MLSELKGKKFPVLDDGFVCLVDAMGDDSDIVQAARTSYQKGTRSVSDDRGLIRYLMSHRHTTPFEMAELKFMVRVPMDCWRQWIRHRMASVNEYSTRYSEAIDERQRTSWREWRLQATANRQGSSGLVSEWPEGFTARPASSPGEYLSLREHELQVMSDEVYKERLAFGVAREQARKDLPLSTYTEAFWKIDLHNLLHFLGLRMDSHAQLEIRTYATIIGEQIVKPLFPLTWEAFEDFRLGAMSLSRLEIEMIQSGKLAEKPEAMTKREWEAAQAKFQRLGIAGGWPA